LQIQSWLYTLSATIVKHGLWGYGV
jgi:hypothetical protein